MKVLISYLTRKSTGDTVHRDEEKTVEVLRIGRATDSGVYLADPRILLAHAAIHGRPAGFFIEAVGNGSLIVNEQVTNSAKIGIGDKLRVGPYEVIVVQAPAEGGFDLALTVELVEPFGNALAALEARSTTSLAAAGVSKRALSWSLLIVVLALFLALPVAAFFVPQIKAPITAALRIGPDKSWDSGEMSTPHKHFGNDCGQCHQVAFRQVKDEACLTCHGKTHHHVDPAKFKLAKLDEASCESCHKEHNGAQPITLRAQVFCTDCHQSLTQVASNAGLLNVGDFGAHPQFRPTVVVEPESSAGKAKWERVSLEKIAGTIQKLPSIYASLDKVPTDPKDDVVCADRTQVEDPRLDTPPADLKDKLRERSGLRFTHCTHLNLGRQCAVNPQTNKVECKGQAPAAEGTFAAEAYRKLDCQDCHQPEPGGVLMQPVSMEKHCAGACHQLKFVVEYAQPGRPEPRKWVRNLPHGKPKEVQEIIKDFYGWLALQPVVLESDQSIMPRARPGQPMTEEDRNDARRWARQKADQMTDVVVAKSSCGDCHRVERGADPREWEIHGATIAHRWMPKGLFDHAKHTSSACTDCHVGARVSNSASDVLLPGVENCQGCHGGEKAAGKVPSTCVDCHQFHIDSKPPMRDKMATSGKSAGLMLHPSLGARAELR